MTFLETADRIGARICRDAIWSGDRANWIACHAEGTADYVHRALGPALYSGAAGIALLLVRLYDATGERIFRLTAEAALRQAFSRRERLREAGAMGFFDGLAGIAYAAGWAAAITGDETYARQAIEIARGIAPCPGRIDVMNGSAGAIPALLALARLMDTGDLVEAAARHARFLIACAHRGECGWSWTTLENCHGDLTGFGHGAAGIAFALLEMFHATGDPACRAAAIEGFRYERSVFRPEEQNWPDFRGVPPPDGKTPCAVMWCAGAPGIGLSRLRAWEVLSDPVYREEAEAAIGTTLRWLADSENGNYSLCHGIAGNVELLLSSGETEYQEIARRVGEAGMERYEKESVPWPCGNHHDDGTPDLMLGLAGIAHFYLRLHDAGKAPSVLMVTR